MGAEADFYAMRPEDRPFITLPKDTLAEINDAVRRRSKLDAGSVRAYSHEKLSPQVNPRRTKPHMMARAKAVKARMSHNGTTFAIKTAEAAKGFGTGLYTEATVVKSVASAWKGTVGASADRATSRLVEFIDKSETIIYHPGLAAKKGDLFQGFRNHIKDIQASKEAIAETKDATAAIKANYRSKIKKLHEATHTASHDVKVQYLKDRGIDAPVTGKITAKMLGQAAFRAHIQSFVDKGLPVPNENFDPKQFENRAKKDVRRMTTARLAQLHGKENSLAAAFDQILQKRDKKLVERKNSRPAGRMGAVLQLSSGFAVAGLNSIRNVGISTKFSIQRGVASDVMQIKNTADHLGSGLLALVAIPVAAVKGAVVDSVAGATNKARNNFRSAH